MRKTITTLASLALAAGAFGGTALAGGEGPGPSVSGGCVGLINGSQVLSLNNVLQGGLLASVIPINSFNGNGNNSGCNTSAGN
jgi:hypothetical protein